MKAIAQLRERPYRVLIGNVAARVAALGSVFVATLVLARNGGPTVVGVYALLHVLPGLLGMLASCGLPGAVAFFLAGPDRDDRRLPLTLVYMALAGGVAGTVLWLVAAPLLQRVLFPGLPLGLVVLAGALVLTRLIVTTAKSCSQGSDDLPGSNRVIFTEQFLFLPAFGVVWGAGARGYAAVVAGLLVADVATSSLAWSRLVRRDFFRNAGRPSRDLARRVGAYGLRAEVGTILSLLNLRLDFILLGALTSPAVLGVYVVASKYAELIRILGMALSYVLYPKFARDGFAKAVVNARRLVPKAGLLTAGAVIPLWFAASFVIPEVYGSAFRPAIVPAQIILLGLALDGVAGVITGFMYGVGRPGLNSLAMSFGLVVTVVLDVLLIPRFGMIGAATASAIAYVTTALALVLFFWRIGRSGRAPVTDDSALRRGQEGRRVKLRSSSGGGVGS